MLFEVRNDIGVHIVLYVFVTFLRYFIENNGNIVFSVWAVERGKKKKRSGLGVNHFLLIARFLSF
jgi:hypothetical protein